MAEIKNPNNYICLDFYFIKLEMCLTAEFICSARLGRRNLPFSSFWLLAKSFAFWSVAPLPTKQTYASFAGAPFFKNAGLY